MKWPSCLLTFVLIFNVTEFQAQEIARLQSDLVVETLNLGEVSGTLTISAGRDVIIAHRRPDHVVLEFGKEMVRAKSPDFEAAVQRQSPSANGVLKNDSPRRTSPPSSKSSTGKIRFTHTAFETLRALNAEIAAQTKLFPDLRSSPKPLSDPWNQSEAAYRALIIEGLTAPLATNFVVEKRISDLEYEIRLLISQPRQGRPIYAWGKYTGANEWSGAVDWVPSKSPALLFTSKSRFSSTGPTSLPVEFVEHRQMLSQAGFDLSVPVYRESSRRSLKFIESELPPTGKRVRAHLLGAKPPRDEVIEFAKFLDDFYYKRIQNSEQELRRRAIVETITFLLVFRDTLAACQ